MAVPDFAIKTGDTASSVSATLENSGGTPVDIQAATVNFKMAPYSGGTLVVAGTAVNAQIGSGTATNTVGDVVYQWAAAPATPGWFNAEFEVIFAGGSIQTFPNTGYFTIAVTDDL